MAKVFAHSPTAFMIVVSNPRDVKARRFQAEQFLAKSVLVPVRRSGSARFLTYRAELKVERGD